MRPKNSSGKFAPAAHPRRIGLAALLLVGVLGACSPAADPTQINDPFEAQNRVTHKFNVTLDHTLLRPVAKAYGGALPGPVRNGVGNFAHNLAEPSNAVNHILQGKIGPSAINLIRFVVNTTVGVGGLFNPASALGVPEQRTDFGETMYVWGLPEGAYLELPVVGPSSQRDLGGTLVDLFTNPLDLAFTKAQRNIALGAKVASRVGDRYRYSDTVDSILYESADSYAQERILYLQNRHYELGMAAPDANFDPYEDPYAK